jgi:hypothetical protein
MRPWALYAIYSAVVGLSCLIIMVGMFTMALWLGGGYVLVAVDLYHEGYLELAMLAAALPGVTVILWGMVRKS